jgi:hypothetical protein
MINLAVEKDVDQYYQRCAANQKGSIAVRLFRKEYPEARILQIFSRLERLLIPKLQARPTSQP